MPAVVIYLPVKEGWNFSFNSILWDLKLEDIILKIRYLTSFIYFQGFFCHILNLRTNNRVLNLTCPNLLAQRSGKTLRHQWRTYFGMATHCKSHTAPMTCKLPDGGLLIGNHLGKKFCLFLHRTANLCFTPYIRGGNMSQELSRSYELWRQKRAQ